MENLFVPNTVATVEKRINTLTPETPNQWGKMNVAQMMAHCSAALDVASGKGSIPRSFIGRVLGPIFKNHAFDDKPYSKGSPTAAQFVITDTRNFNEEKAKLLSALSNFTKGGEAGCTRQPHSFFGALTAQQWGMHQYKHLDHHLRQFGV